MTKKDRAIKDAIEQIKGSKQFLLITLDDTIKKLKDRPDEDSGIEVSFGGRSADISTAIYLAMGEEDDVRDIIMSAAEAYNEDVEKISQN